ncbi:hypothetical protein RJ640_011548 [Escallonia rubra]|uniref:Uncharacterized protein n=1 Tax=Escallonia rubra TaxID=112253 RepID=A0AA88R0D8_9ASTE|nr:hypothetical protein RJ640_011548 [Escallonia rubra]
MGSTQERMDPGLYRAAMYGRSVGFLQEDKHKLEAQLTPNRNTILHIAAMFGNTDCVNAILRNCPSLLSRVNSKGDTAFHIAAREGHSSVIRALVEHAKARDNFAAASNPGHTGLVHAYVNYVKAQEEELEKGFGSAKGMLRMTNEDGNTALHEAVQHCHLDVVKLLAREDPEFSHPANDSDETPLYLATEKGLVSFVCEILKSCSSPSYGGPGGRTALHAAVIFNYEGCTKALLDWKPSLTKEVDMYGWTPLHYAGRFGFVSRTVQLLTTDTCVAYIAARENEMNAALHIAASQGHIGVMKVHLSQCPDCWEMINGRGQNILHIAVEHERKEVIQFILKNTWARYLINQKDVGGNTPLHLYAASNNFVVPELTKHHRLDLMAFNKENMTALDVVTKIDFYRTREVSILTLSEN